MWHRVVAPPTLQRHRGEDGLVVWDENSDNTNGRMQYLVRTRRARPGLKQRWLPCLTSPHQSLPVSSPPCTPSVSICSSHRYALPAIPCQKSIAPHPSHSSSSRAVSPLSWAIWRAAGWGTDWQPSVPDVVHLATQLKKLLALEDVAVVPQEGVSCEPSQGMACMLIHHNGVTTSQPS